MSESAPSGGMNALEKSLDLVVQQSRFHGLVDALTERDAWVLVVGHRSEDDQTSAVTCDTNAHHFEAMGLLHCALEDLRNDLASRHGENG